MIRYSLLWLFVAGLIRYAWKDWCKALAVLIVLLAVLERPDMPKQMFGIPGFNPFNVALAGILVAWVANFRRENYMWDVPRWLSVLFVLYIGLMLVSTARMLVDPSYLVVYQTPAFRVQSMSNIITENLINTFKWVIPALLLIHGCRGEERQKWLIAAAIGVYAVLAVLVIRQMPLGFLLDGGALEKRAVAVLQRRVGYHRVDLAMMFAGAAWAVLAARPLFASWRVRTGLLGVSGIIVLGLALTGGRTGYAAFCVVGLILSVLKWRRNLILMPVAVVCLLLFAPGVSQRMLQGFGNDGDHDTAAITSGRTVVWPYVIRKIAERPSVGYGRQAWVRTNLRMEVTTRTGEGVGHPHNAYLEFMLDNGVIGIAILLPFYGLIVWRLTRMFLARDNPMVSAAGGMALAMTLSYLIAGMGAQTFYPTESAVPMFCLIALAIRVAADAKPATALAMKPVAVTTARTRPIPAGIRAPVTGVPGRPAHWPQPRRRDDALARGSRR